MSNTLAASADQSVSTTAPEAVVFTVKQARTNSGPLANVDTAIQTVKSAKSNADRVVGQVMWNAALLTHSVVTSGHVGSGKDATMTQGDYVAALGFSAAYGTALKRLGRAAVVHGVKRGTPLWGFLCSKAGDAKVGKAIALDDTAAALAALKGFEAEYREHGRITSGASTPRVDDGTGSGEGTGSDSDGGEGTVTVTLTPAQAVDAALQTLDAALKSLPVDDRETFAMVENRLTAILAREVTLRVESVTA